MKGEFRIKKPINSRTVPDIHCSPCCSETSDGKTVWAWGLDSLGWGEIRLVIREKHQHGSARALAAASKRRQIWRPQENQERQGSQRGATAEPLNHNSKLMNQALLSKPPAQKVLWAVDPRPPSSHHPKKTIKGNLIGQVKCKKLGIGGRRACVKNLVMQWMSDEKGSATIHQ